MMLPEGKRSETNMSDAGSPEITLAAVLKTLEILSGPDMTAANAMSEERLIQYGGVPIVVRMAIGADAARTIIDDGRGGHSLEALLGMNRGTPAALRHDADQASLIVGLERLWRDRRLPAHLVNVQTLEGTTSDGLSKTVDSLRHGDRGRTIGELVPDIVAAIRRDMPDLQDVSVGRVQTIWSTTMEYGLVVSHRPARDGAYMLCRTQSGHEFTHHQNKEDFIWSRMPVGSRIHVERRACTAEHPGYVHHVIEGDSIDSLARSGRIGLRRQTYVDVNLDVAVVLTSNVRDAEMGSVGRVSGYGDGTCRVILERDLREISVRAENMMRKRRPRNGKRRITAQSIL